MTSLLLGGCAFRSDQVGQGDLSGTVVVEWAREDRFIYRKQPRNPVQFKPSFLQTAIVPEDMFTDGGSVPRIFWSVPGLSPWALAPAYIIHDWIFEVHRCKRPAPPEIANLTFEDSARILAEVGVALVNAELVDNNRLPEIVWAVQTRFARDIWDRPPRPSECDPPEALPQVSARTGLRTGGGQRVFTFQIPRPPRR
jgi:hypothetical protein